MMLKVLVLGPLVGKLTLAHAYTPEAQHLPNRSKGDANLVARLSNTHNSLQSIGLAHRKVAGPAETASQGRSLSEKDRALDKRGLTISNLVRVLKLGALTYLARGQHGSRNSETLRQDQKQVRSFLARRGAELHPSTRAELEQLAPHYTHQVAAVVDVAERTHPQMLPLRPDLTLDHVLRTAMRFMPLRDLTREEGRRVLAYGEEPKHLLTYGQHKEHVDKFSKQERSKRRQTKHLKTEDL